MTTLNGLVDECLLNLASYGLVQPLIGRLTAPCDADDTTLTLNSVANVKPGLAEMGTELVYVLSKDSGGSTVEVIRGYLSTTAASHVAGQSFVCNPPWPRAVVQNAVNDAIVASYPDLFVIDVVTVTPNSAQTSYDLDPAVERVRNVHQQLLGPSEQWVGLKNFHFDAVRSKLVIEELVVPGRPLSVTIQRAPATLAPAEDLTDSGLQQSAKKYVVAQACADLVKSLDANRLPSNVAAADDMDQNRPVGSATNVARVLLSVAEIEKRNERRRLLEQYPATVNFARNR